jgi:hypothetical protein
MSRSAAAAREHRQARPSASLRTSGSTRLTPACSNPRRGARDAAVQLGISHESARLQDQHQILKTGIGGNLDRGFESHPRRSHGS